MRVRPEIAYLRQPNWGFGGFDLLNGEWPPKGSIMRENTPYDELIVKIGLRARAQRDIKNKERKVRKKKGRLRNQNMAYDTRCYFNVRSKADMIRLNLPHGDDN